MPSPSPLAISHQLVAEEIVGDPAKGERHPPVLAFDQLQLAAVVALEPGEELRALPTVAERSSRRTCAGNMPRDSSQTMPCSGSAKLWNSSMTTAETLLKSKASLVQQAIEEDFGDDDQDAGVRVDAAVAGDEAESSA